MISIEREHENKKEDIKSFQKLIDLQDKKMPYHLHAIIIHDGSADMGHYYTFIFDRFKKVWWKINDSMVREEAEDVVMEEA